MSDWPGPALLRNMTAWLDVLSECPCLARGCGRFPPQMHHAVGGSMSRNGYHRGISQKPSDWLAIPLCEFHHTGRHGLHQIGVVTWEMRFDQQLDMLIAMMLVTRIDLFAHANKDFPTERLIEIEHLGPGARMWQVASVVNRHITGDTIEQAGLSHLRTLGTSPGFRSGDPANRPSG